MTAVVASIVLAAMLFASRLPLGGDFLLPRRGGFGLYRAAWALFDRPAGRWAFSAAAALLLLACAAAFGAALRRALRRRPAGASQWAGAAAGPVFALILAWRLGGRWLDLIQLVYFPYASMDVREPFVDGALFAVALVPAAAAARDWVAGRRRRAIILAAALIALDAGAALFGAYRGVGRPLTPPSASGRTAYVVLTDGPRGPGTDTYELAPDVFSDPDPRPYLRGLAAAPRDARNLPALRALYQEESKRWDLDGLRDALLLGVARRDPLAPSLLLSHFTAVRRSTQALAALGVVSDESAWRVGPLGAAALARAYAHLGDRASAARWAARSGEAGGIAPGLLGLDAVGTGAAGRVTGVLRGADHARVALYSKEDPAAPYLLGAAGLAASVEPDSRGRFVFTGLTAGRYYLAVALPGGRGEAAVTGGRGDIVLDAAHPARVLPPLTASFIAR